MKVYKYVAHEINYTIYDTSDKDFAMMLEWLRQEQVRIRARWVGNEFKPYEGYIVQSNNISVEEGKELFTPLIVWRRDSRRGMHLSPSILDTIEYSNKQLGGLIWKRGEGIKIAPQNPNIIRYDPKKNIVSQFS